MAVFADPGELRHTQPETSLHAGGNLIGKGTLVISDNSIVWSAENKKVTLLFPSIILHAVCRDSNMFPHDCLYLHTDAEIPGISQARSEDSEDEGHDECPPITELYFVPDDKQCLDTIYQIMALCQALHPDPNDDFSPDEDFFDEDEEIHADNPHAQLENMHISENGTNGTHDDHEMFEDADEEFPDH